MEGQWKESKEISPPFNEPVLGYYPHRDPPWAVVVLNERSIKYSEVNEVGPIEKSKLSHPVEEPKLWHPLEYPEEKT